MASYSKRRKLDQTTEQNALTKMINQHDSGPGRFRHNPILMMIGPIVFLFIELSDASTTSGFLLTSVVPIYHQHIYGLGLVSQTEPTRKGPFPLPHLG